MIIDMGQNNRCGKVLVNIPVKGRRILRRKIFEKNGERKIGKITLIVEEKEKDENIWRRFFSSEVRKRRKKM